MNKEKYGLSLPCFKIWGLLCLLTIFSSALMADPLLVAVRSLDMNMFNLHINGQPDVTATDSAGMTALHHACVLGAVDMVAALLKKGANPSQLSENGNNAMHYAVSTAQLCFDPQPQKSDVVICPLTIPQLLASAGADVNLLNKDGEAPLHIAARNGLVGVIATLIQAGADPNIKNKHGATPLHIVGGMMSHIAAQVLILKGADLDATNNELMKPVDIAVKSNNALLINIIKQYEHKKF